MSEEHLRFKWRHQNKRGFSEDSLLLAKLTHGHLLHVNEPQKLQAINKVSFVLALHHFYISNKPAGIIEPIQIIK